jgi:hypothetical protein
MMARPIPAPPLQISQWFNSASPITLESLRGRVVVMHAFQMLCPGCVSHGIPQAAAVHEAFPPDDVVVLGLHTVFEHHAAMTPIALEAFIHEYRIAFAVGVDTPSAHDAIPLTMQAYAMRGTPTLILLDRQGQIRLHHFGRLDDLRLGAAISTLRAELASSIDSSNVSASKPSAVDGGVCDADGCAVRP